MKTCHLNSCCWVASMGKKQNNSFATSPRPSREHWDMAVAHCCVSCLSRWKCFLFPTLSWDIRGCTSILCTIWLCDYVLFMLKCGLDLKWTTNGHLDINSAMCGIWSARLPWTCWAYVVHSKPSFHKIDPKLLNTLVRVTDGSTVSHPYAEGSLFTFSLVLPSLLKFRQWNGQSSQWEAPPHPEKHLKSKTSMGQTHQTKSEKSSIGKICC